MGIPILGFSYKKRKIAPSKVDKEKQKNFIKEYKKLRKEQKTDEKLYYIDKVHPTHNVMPAYASIKKGIEKEVKSNKGRQRVNINGAYRPDEVILKDFENLYNTSAKLFD